VVDVPTLPELVELARSWAAGDPDGETRHQALELADSADLAALADHFGASLRFGTAGLRGAMGPGPNRMNRAVVRRAAFGVATWVGPGGRVVVGHDARHRSATFAEDSARVLAARGCQALLLPSALPTPLLAFAVRWLGARAGVMVTASHNPAADNGYKVYAVDGAQIVPPVDDEIARHIDASPPADEIPLAASDDDGVVRLDDEVVTAYVEHAADTARGGPRGLRIVYTPMHGVGGEVATAVLARAGFADVHVVPEQAEPDPDFPTVAFPNPEEPGALDHAKSLADSVAADLILANDPDADRLGVAILDDGAWRQLTGNEVGWLLGQHVLDTTEGADRLVVTTIVSDDLLDELAAETGVHSRRVLTGFKWVVRPALEDPSLRFVFGYEEALGYSVDEYVRDKDGITAALAVAELAGRLADEGRDLASQLDALARRFGLHVTDTWSVRLTGVEGERRIAEAMAALRSEPPGELAGRRVTSVTDYLTGGDLPPADVVQLDLERARVIARPSGTEPKLKVYLRVVVPVEAGDIAAARASGMAEIHALQSAVRSRIGL
jgi:phosphomannomutase